MQWTQRALGYAPRLESALQLRREIEALENQDIISIPSLGSAYRKPINLEFRDAPVKAIFDALSRSTGINFIFDREIRSDQRATAEIPLKEVTFALDDNASVPYLRYRASFTATGNYSTIRRFLDRVEGGTRDVELERMLPIIDAVY